MTTQAWNCHILTLRRHLILTYNTSLQIYSAADSLLVRRIPISTLDTSAPQGSTPANIAATRLSTQDPEFVWVACSDGQIYHVNWTHSAEISPAFQTDSRTAKAMVVVPAQGQNNKEETILVVESDKPNRMEVNAYQGLTSSRPKVRFNSILALKKPGSGLQLLEASADGQVLIGAFHDRLFLGVASQSGADEPDKLQYEFFSFDTPDLITTLDLRIYKRSVSTSSARKTQVGSDTVVDIIAGGARGGIYVYHDALSRVQAEGKPQFVKDGIQVQKFHWHRKAVHSVKWSRDGTCRIQPRYRCCLLTADRQLLRLWRIRELSRHLAGRYGKEGLPPTSVRQRGKHCRVCVGLFLCSPSGRQFCHDHLNCRNEANGIYLWHPVSSH